MQLIILFTVAIQEIIMGPGDDEQKKTQTTIMKAKHRQELKQYDMRLVLELDQKVKIVLKDDQFLIFKTSYSHDN